MQKYVTLYKTELNKARLPSLVADKKVEYKDTTYTCPKEIVDMLNDVFNHGKQTEEYLYLMAFDTKLRLKGVFEISHGDMLSSIADPKIIFNKALLCGAYAIALAHNHPSGDVTPSESDIVLCKRVALLSELHEMKLIDFFVLSEDNYLSFQAQSLIPEVKDTVKKLMKGANI